MPIIPEKRIAKTLICGHEQVYSTPVPKPGEAVWCLRCDGESRVPYNRPMTVSEGRPHRLKDEPKSNNQFVKGRKLVPKEC